MPPFPSHTPLCLPAKAPASPWMGLIAQPWLILGYMSNPGEPPIGMEILMEWSRRAAGNGKSPAVGCSGSLCGIRLSPVSPEFWSTARHGVWCLNYLLQSSSGRLGKGDRVRWGWGGGRGESTVCVVDARHLWWLEFVQLTVGACFFTTRFQHGSTWIFVVSTGTTCSLVLFFCYHLHRCSKGDKLVLNTTDRGPSSDLTNQKEGCPKSYLWHRSFECSWKCCLCGLYHKSQSIVRFSVYSCCFSGGQIWRLQKVINSNWRQWILIDLNTKDDEILTFSRFVLISHKEDIGFTNTSNTGWQIIQQSHVTSQWAISRHVGEELTTLSIDRFRETWTDSHWTFLGHIGHGHFFEWKMDLTSQKCLLVDMHKYDWVLAWQRGSNDALAKFAASRSKDESKKINQWNGIRISAVLSIPLSLLMF